MKTQNNSDMSRAAQRQLLLSWLKKHGAITTIEARELLSILHPCERIMEMRKMGLSIKTVWVIEHDCLGQSHRVGKYILTTIEKN